MRTPAVLVFLMIIDYFFQEVFQFVGLNSIAGIFTSICFVVMVALITWCYVRYSGNGRDAGTAIDAAVNWTWENLLQQAVLPASQVGLQFAANVSGHFFKQYKTYFFQATANATKKRN